MGFEIVAITVVDFLAAELLLLQIFFSDSRPLPYSYKNVAFAFSTFNQEKSTFCKLQSHEHIHLCQFCKRPSIIKYVRILDFIYKRIKKAEIFSR